MHQLTPQYLIRQLNCYPGLGVTAAGVVQCYVIFVASLVYQPVDNANNVCHNGADDVQTPAAAADGTVRPAKRQKSMLPAETEDLDADELHAYKRRLVDMLQPHETVLAALRRLGGVKRSGPAPAELSWKRVKKGTILPVFAQCIYQQQCQHSVCSSSDELLGMCMLQLMQLQWALRAEDSCAAVAFCPWNACLISYKF